ncbi:unnamed protein product, partial [Dicrocoelium dendriticum]
MCAALKAVKVQNANQLTGPGNDSKLNGRKAKPKRLPSKGICGLGECHRVVKIGLACSHCLEWYHTKCANVSQQQLRERNSSQDAFWFCTACSTIPLVKCLLILAEKCDRLIAEAEQRINNEITSMGASMDHRSVAAAKQRNAEQIDS